jgi:deoxyribose-phosphate aldolase
MVQETLGAEWLSPHLFRFGASTLANDLLRQILKELRGRYVGSGDLSEA